ncbi:hypothetical protein [Pseudonocardia parietis]|uniref:Uncharacterized protein n=1 Tax=Pseudonocardia parietis TaxID=570936 RepID=A0ABS4W5E4_9PSEU|nr:hypothetical protein [Pseudonocardia parietis]MBP2371430.1 hypothetical protein [Pseudonocardia parietis]
MTDILDRNRSSRAARAGLGIARGRGGRSGDSEEAGTGEWVVRHRVMSAAGAAGSGLAFILAWHLSRQQTIRRHRAQASRIRLRASPTDPGRGQLQVTNASDQPVHAALVRPVRIRTERSRRTAWLSRTTLTVEHPITVDRTLWPGSSISIAATAFDEMPVLYFSSTQGHSWVRDVHGHLRAIARVQDQVSGRWS